MRHRRLRRKRLEAPRQSPKFAVDRSLHRNGRELGLAIGSLPQGGRREAVSFAKFAGDVGAVGEAGKRARLIDAPAARGDQPTAAPTPDTRNANGKRL